MSTPPEPTNEEIVRIGKIFLAEDGIVRFMQLPDVDLALEDAQEIFTAYLKIRQDKRCPVLVDARQMRSFTRGARQYLASDEATASACAVAMIIDTPLSQVLGNFYLGLSNPRLPTRLFTNEEKALEWLRGYIE